MRLVLGVGLFVGLGSISLWPLVSQHPFWVVLGAGYCLGACVGKLEVQWQFLRLGAVATRSLL